MRRSSRPSPSPLPAPDEIRLGRTLARLPPYLWNYRWRVIAALTCLVLAKVATVSVPLSFKGIIDELTTQTSAMTLPVTLLCLYGALRFTNSLFTELREILFARVSQESVRRISLEVFRHLHRLSLRFHLERQMGGITRDIERGSRSISSLINYTLYSILPTLVELALVLIILLLSYDLIFVTITGLSLATYIVFTVMISNWRIALRRAANDSDSAANSQAIDSLLNYETVKYFNNEEFEAQRYDDCLRRWEQAATRSQVSLSWLNMGQQFIIAAGVTAMMWQATVRVVEGSMTVGDLVLVNAFLIQLYLPLNFLGVIYREIRQALADIERMFGLLAEHQDIVDAVNAKPLPPGPVAIEFCDVSFGYDPRRDLLNGVRFEIPAGQTIAVVGESGSGKSTLARLLFRFYEVGAGAIRCNGTDIRQLTQASLRGAIGIVPQDTVLFNDTIYYNILYGRPNATADEVFAAAEAAQLSKFIEQLPDRYTTQVGERGLKLSGGEKQRVAIARALLKNPPILIFDEATSALDSRTELAIQSSLESAAVGRTTLIIAHRLSTVMNADQILVLENGNIIERGTHLELLAGGGRYATMWALQQQESP